MPAQFAHLEWDICQYHGCKEKPVNGKYCSREHAPYGYLGGQINPAKKPKVKKKDEMVCRHCNKWIGYWVSDYICDDCRRVLPFDFKPVKLKIDK